MWVDLKVILWVGKLVGMWDDLVAAERVDEWADEMVEMTVELLVDEMVG